MNKRPGQVRVTIETGYCSFCGRPRNLRREEHQLGTLVRSIVTCETCHRTLSSSVGVASAEPVAAEAPVAVKEPVETADEVVRLALDLFGAREKVFEDGARELLTFDHVPQLLRDSHEKISFPGSPART